LRVPGGAGFLLCEYRTGIVAITVTYRSLFVQVCVFLMMECMVPGARVGVDVLTGLWLPFNECIDSSNGHPFCSADENRQVCNPREDPLQQPCRRLCSPRLSSMLYRNAGRTNKGKAALHHPQKHAYTSSILGCISISFQADEIRTARVQPRIARLCGTVVAGAVPGQAMSNLRLHDACNPPLRVGTYRI
jgi:hypothetical protein